MARFTCPECAARVKVSDSHPKGARIRCLECGARFDPGAADFRDEAERPSGKKRRKKGASGARIAVLLIGGGVAVLLAVGLIVLGIVLLSPGSVGPNGLLGSGPGGLFGASKVTVENFNKLARGMTVNEAEAILGPGKVCTASEMLQASGVPIQPVPAGNAAPPAPGDVTSWRRWQNGGLDVFVGFRKGKSGVERLCCYNLLNNLPGGAVETESQDDNPLEDLDATAAARAKDEQLVQNPKWKTGASIRAALLGKWRLAGGAANDRWGWDFGANGTCVHYGAFGQDSVAPGTYRFLDDTHIETSVSQPDPFPGKPPTQVTERFRVLVDDKELVLVYDNPDGPSPTPALSREP